MGVVFTWLDFSSAERERTLAVLASLQQKGTVDDLGIGAVRDAIADHLFPGISTIQTRAKYFLYVAWLLRALENSKVSDDRIELVLREREVKLIDALLGDPEDDSRDRDGLIGKEARENLKRFPSSIYWNGLCEFGICQFEGSLSEYLRALPEIRLEKRNGTRQIEASDEPEEDPGSWDGSLPLAESDYLHDAAFALQTDQARYLIERACSCMSPSGDETLLAWCLRRLPEFEPESFEWPWDLTSIEELPRHLRLALRHARNFSTCIEGAYAAYHLLLARKLQNEEAVARYKRIVDDWVERLEVESRDLNEWSADIGKFWDWIFDANPATKRDVEFVNAWCRHLSTHRFSLKSDHVLTRDTSALIRNREQFLKKGLARLSNPKALARWEANVAAQPLNYRWRNAVRFMRDLRKGLANGGENA